jgi:hypothetical protein
MPKLRLTWLLAVIVFASLETPVHAFADDPHPPPAERPENGYWSEGQPRFFLAGRPEFGTPYAKPYFSAGYGLPHWIWTGIDVNSILTTDCFQVYGGVRAATPILDLAFGVRDTWSFDKTFLDPRDSFHSDDLSGSGRKARYWAYEAEAVGAVPLPHAAIVGDFIAIGALDAPKGKYFYDESYRAVVADSLFFVMRVAVVARLLNENSFKVGVLTEHVFGTDRGEPVTRIGPAFSLQLTDHLEVNAVLTLKVAGPDHLGLIDGTYGVAGVRWRFATGEPAPKFPWKEDLIPLH